MKIDTATSERFDVEAFHSQLDTQFLGVGTRLVFLPVVDSTNTLAMQLARDEADEGTVVFADSQRAGRGRLGRHWVDQSGYNILASTILRPHFPPYLLVMIASLAIVDAISDTCDLRAAIKWPNDVLLDERKVSGILIETSHDRASRLTAIIGIGINVNGSVRQLVEKVTDPTSINKGLLETATTLQTACGHKVSRETFLARLLHHLETSYLLLQQEACEPITSSHEPASRLIRERWRQQLSTLGRTIQVRQGDSLLGGVAEDVDEHGELLLRCHSGTCVSITWGDVWYS